LSAGRVAALVIGIFLAVAGIAFLITYFAYLKPNNIL